MELISDIFLIWHETHERHVPMLWIESRIRLRRHSQWTVAQTNESITPSEKREEEIVGKTDW